MCSVSCGGRGPAVNAAAALRNPVASLRMTMPTYAVTGASGHLGCLAVQELLARGVQVREADYSRPETLGAALAGGERLLASWPPSMPPSPAATSRPAART